MLSVRVDELDTADVKFLEATTDSVTLSQKTEGKANVRRSPWLDAIIFLSSKHLPGLEQECHVYEPVRSHI
jgi:hypothetical protein